jgi:hypothetical protein
MNPVAAGDTIIAQFKEFFEAKDPNTGEELPKQKQQARLGLRIIDFEGVGGEVTDMALRTWHPEHAEKVLPDPHAPNAPKF